ncbi:MAG: hypothetical protein K1X64_16995 [Myxococcaceae bacterium]|nr:hypothetical protein [Myxococcaceae bacterium]
MPTELRGFALSWFFSPYSGSADLDFYKRIKDTPFHYDLVQLQREKPDQRLLQFTTRATIERFEVKADHLNPRTLETREKFATAAVELFKERRNSYDFIISHSNEIPSHAVAWQCKQLAPKTPWVAYFGDLFTKNPYIKYIDNYPLVDEDIETEALTLKKADLIICNNDYQKRLMFTGELEAYADKAVVIPHCFDPAMFPTRHNTVRNGRFTFMHLGTLYHVKRTAEPLLRGVERLIEVYPEYKDRFEVLFYGGPYYSHDLNVHASMRHRSNVRLEEGVPYLQSLELMQRADALVLIDGIFDKNIDGLSFNPFFPGKLTDYMGANRPIMGITMKEGPTTDILHESGNLTADLKPDRIAYVLKRYIDRKVPQNSISWLPYTCEAVAAQMTRVIYGAINGALGADLQRSLKRPVTILPQLRKDPAPALPESTRAPANRAAGRRPRLPASSRRPS